MTTPAFSTDAMPCPFCGDDAVITITDETNSRAAYCTTCFATGPSSHSEAAAVASWNQRKGI